MHYMMLIYLSENWSALPSDEKNRVHAACGAWHDELVRSGHSRAAYALQPSAATKALRARNGKLAVTDGPFAETKEVLGGLEILECENLDQALAIAGRFPALEAGCTVEVRPLITANTCRD